MIYAIKDNIVKVAIDKEGIKVAMGESRIQIEVRTCNKLNNLYYKVC